MRTGLAYRSGMDSTRSIYSDPLRTTVCRQPTARAAQRARAQDRRDRLLDAGPPRHLDRLSLIESALRMYRSGQGDAVDGPSPLAQLLAETTQEVERLEGWAASLPQAHRRSGAVMRQALEFLRGFSRLSVLDFRAVPQEDREHLVQWLALEHRWCYAAAGTCRVSFKAAAGRTGAR